MYRNKYKQIDNAVNIINGFLEVTGFTDDQFENYMKKNNLWSKLDTNSIVFSSWMEPEHYLNILGDGLSQHEKDAMINRFNKVENE